MPMRFIEGIVMGSCSSYQGHDLGYPVISVNFKDVPFIEWVALA